MQFLQLVISGIAQGCIYGLIALGFVLIYKATETVSFAQGELMMVGAFAGLALMTMLNFPYWLSVPCAIAAMAAFGMATERLVIRPILGQPAFSIVMLTIGIGYLARGLITMIPGIGTETHTLPVPYKDAIVNVGGLVINIEQMVVIASTAVLCAVLFALFRYSKVGVAMQASSQNQLAAYYMGIPVQRLNGLVWGLAATAYVCGTRQGIIDEVEPRDGAEFANSYEACKADAERLVQASGVPHAIARPSIVVGDSQTGAIRQFDTIYAALKLIAEGRVASMPARAEASLDFVPIDHVARGIVAIAETMDRAAGGIFHLVANRALSIPDFFETLDGYDFFKRPAIIAPEAFDLGGLSPLERRVFGRLLGPYAGYFQRSPRFNDDRLRALTGLECPPTGKDFFKTLVDYCISVGFLGAKAQRTSG